MIFWIWLCAILAGYAIFTIVYYLKKIKPALFTGQTSFATSPAEPVNDEQKAADHEKLLDQFLCDWRYTFDVIDDPVIIADASLRIVRANAAARKLFSVEDEEIIGKNCHHLIDGSNEQCSLCALIKGQQNNSPNTQEIKSAYLGKVFSITCTPINNTNSVEGYLFSIKDISHQRQLERQLLQAHKMEAIATLAGGIAHDFNNILGAILGNADLLLYRLPDDSGKPHSASPAGASAITNQEVVEHIESIKRAGNRAKELVTQILAFSRQSASQKKAINIAPLVKESCKLLRSSLPATIRMHVAVAEDLGLIMADPGQIQQVVMNLVNNAAQSLEGNVGEIDISLRATETGRAEQKRYPDLQPGRYIVLTVKDTGKGIKEEDVQRIFDPFFTTRSVGDGSGMGLAVLHGIIVDHEGVIDVKSAVDKGTAFTIFFPKMEEEETSEENVVVAMPGGTETILFVDDEEEIVTMRTRMLEYLGYTVLPATSPEEALQYFQDGKIHIDLLITDHTMPRMTGLQLAQAALHYQHNLPVILCSGYSDPITPEAAQAIGICRFLAKPLDMRLLATEIREILPDTSREKV